MNTPTPVALANKTITTKTFDQKTWRDSLASISTIESTLPGPLADEEDDGDSDDRVDIPSPDADPDPDPDPDADPVSWFTKGPSSLMLSLLLTPPTSPMS